MKGLEGRSGRHYPVGERVVVSQEEIWDRMKAVAECIAADYKAFHLTPANPLILLCVLKGSYLFTADLCRFLSDYGVPVRVEFVCVSSYGDDVTTSGHVRMLLDVRDSVEGKHVLIVEDIIESATTLVYLQRLMLSRRPASLKTVVLLDKPEGRRKPFTVDYVVKEVPMAFVVGYGLDFMDAYRELRDVLELKREYYEKPSKL